MTGDHNRKLTQARSDAIHRALLAGLLSNIGNRTDRSEYTGPHNRKFMVFPGSALFKSRPAWIMAAEVVLTTRLYARTVAPVQPQWIERLAGHLVRRTYSEPHYQHQSGNVVAYEKVSLWGLELIPRRLVHYGPIEPALSRQIFIQHALVEPPPEAADDEDSEQPSGSGQQSAPPPARSKIADRRPPGAAKRRSIFSVPPFLLHNRRLVGEVRDIEARHRRSDLLVDPQLLYDFYDQRIPEGIYNTQLFEAWRIESERRDPKLLYLRREDLLRQQPQQARSDFPDALQIGSLRVPLSYRFEPGHPADGVTAAIPLPAVAQLPPEPFEWLVPGMLEERLTALIRNLPKQIRTRLVPAPEAAARAAREVSFGQGRFADAAARALGRGAGMPVSDDQIDLGQLPDHLRMNYRIVDDAGSELASGRDLPELRQRLARQARISFAKLPPGPYNRSDITRWDFGDLPETVEIAHQGGRLAAYPALVEEGEKVSLRLLESKPAADAAHRHGVRRLFMIQLQRELRDLLRSGPDMQRMCLHYRMLGPCDQLKRDLLIAIADQAIYSAEAGAASGLDPESRTLNASTAPPRTQEQFAELAAEGWRRLSTAAGPILAAVDEALEIHHALRLRLGERLPDAWRESVEDIRGQLDRLVHPGFIARTPPRWLVHMPRYLRGIAQRLRKLSTVGTGRDLELLRQLQPLQQRWLDHRDRAADPAVQQYRWLLEELRISLFAQELKTAVPVSIKRLSAMALISPA